MGLRFSKRVTLLPGVRLNVSGSGLGLSVGPRGASVSIGRNGVYGNLGLPGTGLSYRTKLSGSKPRGRSSAGQGSQPTHVRVTLNDDGELCFRDETGALVGPSIIKRFKAEHGAALQEMLEAAAIRLNQDLEACLSIHMGDNRSGAGDGDDEQVNVKLAGLGADIKRLVFAVTIHEAEARKQSFGQVSNAAIRVVNKADGKELARYDLSEDSALETAMVFGELYRNGEEWKFKAIGQGFAGGLGPLASSYGVNIG